MAAQGYIGRAPGESSVIVARQTFTPTGITTNFTFASGYTVGYVDAYLNGARLIEGDDYTATDGSVVGLTTHAQNGDVLELVVYKAFNVSNVVAANDDFSVGGDLSVTGTSALTGNATVGSAITMYASAGIVSATQFFADGVLINPGAGGTWANYDSNAGVSTTKKVKIENNLEVTGAASTFSGNLTVGGVLTYDDVTNVDAVGYATFRSGVNVQGAGSTTTTLNVTGFSTFSDNVSIGDSIFHTGDIDTSIRFPAANTFTVETGGTESLRVNPRGQLLVGITTNTGTVDAAAVFGSERSSHDYAKIYFVSNTSNPSDDTALGFIGFSQDTLTNVANAFVAVRADGDHASDDYPTRFEFWTTNDGAAVASEKLRITSAGLVGIGTDSPLDLLHITSASGDARVVIQGTVNNDSELKFYEGGTNKFTIGHDAATGEFRIGSVNVDTSVKLKINAAGDATFSGVATATQFDATSDIALKENIEIIDEPITKLSELKGVTFDWKKGGHSVGVIAQDVEKVLPTAVGGSKDQKTVNYNAIIGLLVESVKDQQKQIEELKSLLDK